MYIAGTTIEETPDLKGSTLLANVFAVTSGLTLSQVLEITGLYAPALQNWIKRGWASSPVNKKYNIDQVARIIIINILRETMPLESIAFLLRYINGDANSRLDDIIPESRLYNYFCRINELYEGYMLDTERTKSIINKVCTDYTETIKGGEKRLKKALAVMVYAYRASIIKKEAENILSELRDNEDE